MRYLVLLAALTFAFGMYHIRDEEEKEHDQQLGLTHYHPDMGLVRGSERCHQIKNGYLCQAGPAYLSQKPF